jgi:hypothetical protein
MKDRRRATDGKLVEESKSNAGYYKYQFTIKEIDGSENIIPSYGVDMTDALQRILKHERKEKLSVFITWIIMVGLSIMMPNQPGYALYGTIGLMSLVLVVAVYNFIKNLNQ